jgi:DNA ligase-1
MGNVRTAFETLDKIAAAKGSKEKTKILGEACWNDIGVASVLMEYFRFCFDPFITFGITIDKKDLRPDLSQDFLSDVGYTEWFVKLQVLLERLNNREITGNAARFEVYALDLLAPPLLSRWLLPLVNRDLKIGLSTTSIHKIFPGLLRKFDCQLCTEWDGESIPLSTVVEPKYDGVRCLLFLNPGDRSFALSRNGKPLNNVSHLINELLTVVDHPCVVDGECFTEDWSKSISAVRSDENGDTSARLCAFDLLPLSEFNKQACTQVLSVRQGLLSILLAGLRYSKFTPGIPVTTPEDVRRASSYWVDKGFEGGVIKDLNSLYSYTRDLTWQKIKPFISLDLPIVGFEEGQGRNEGRLGAFVVESNGVKSRVGSMPDSVRDQVWAAPDLYMGRIIECKCQNITPDGALRFPTFLRFRVDKD